MKLDLRPHRPTFVAPTFGADDTGPISEDMRRRMRRPMLIGAGVIGVFILGLGLWAAVTPLASGITAPGEVRVEANRKTIRHRAGGTVRQILVKEGQRVRAGQTLILFDDVEPRAALSLIHI